MKMLDEFFQLVNNEPTPPEPVPPVVENCNKAEPEISCPENQDTPIEFQAQEVDMDSNDQLGLFNNDNLEAPVEETPEKSVLIVPQDEFYSRGGSRYTLVYEGVCVKCAHCGLALTDGESIERGLGPICSKKGYFEEVEPRDSTEAMLALAEYPKLVDYLVAKYKEKGNRSLVNGLTRTASLNRRTPVHAACTDAIDALGYKKLASALRESIVSLSVFDMKEFPDMYGLWVKRADFSWNFYNQLRTLEGVRMVKYPQKATLIPRIHRLAMARIMVQHYTGLYLETPKGSFKISDDWFKSMGR